MNYENDEDFCRSLCILFLSFRNEITDIHTKDVKLVAQIRRTIDQKKKNLKNITLIELLENMEKICLCEGLKNVENELLYDEYIEDETTYTKDREEFEKLSKKDETQWSHFKDAIDMRLDTFDFLELIYGLNYQQRHLFDDFVERICDTTEDKQLSYLYIGGEAGTGKSHLLKTLIEPTKYLLERN